MKKTFIIGIGSVLRGDDGVGMKAVDALREEKFPGNVELIAGDISGLDLIKYFPENGRVIIIDAADMNEPAGTIKVFKSSSIKPSDFSDSFSTHGMGLLETLTLADSLNLGCDVTIIGVQPENTEYSLELTDTIKRTVPLIIDKVKEIVR